jgi:hypothetical protein
MSVQKISEKGRERIARLERGGRGKVVTEITPELQDRINQSGTIVLLNRSEPKSEK